MKTLNFANGDSIPVLGLGTWKSAPGEVKQAVIEAVKAGIRHIDCAAIYGNEKEIGEAFSELFKAGIVQRDDLFITSKLWNNMHHFDDVEPALRKTLEDLQLDYLDLYLIHWPVAHKKEVIHPKDASGFLPLSEVPLIETWEGMLKAQDIGLAKHIGVSNFSSNKLQFLINNSRKKPEMNQVESHPYFNQNDLFDFCQRHEILFTAYSPLGSRDRNVEDAPDLFSDSTVQQIASTHACTPAQILIAWAINRGTIVIPKTVTPSRMKENLKASEIVLSDDEMHQLNQLDRKYRFIDGSFWIKEGNGYTLESLWG